MDKLLIQTLGRTLVTLCLLALVYSEVQSLWLVLTLGIINLSIELQVFLVRTALERVDLLKETLIEVLEADIAGRGNWSKANE